VTTRSPRVTDVRRYPVKSMRGESVASVVVEPWGPAGDRRWMLVDDDGRAVTAREVNHLLLVTPTLVDDGLRLESPGRDPIGVRRPDPSLPGVTVPVGLWRSELTAADAGEEAARWCSDVAGRAVRLVHLDDPRRRPSDPGYSEPGDRVSLADGYPLLLTTASSLAALNDELMGTGTGREPLVMDRFRPNVVVGGTAPWAEDDWRRVRIGPLTFRAVKGCARCVMTTVDPGTGDRGHEPTRSLARIRRWDRQTWFGVNLVPDLDAASDGPWPELRLGDDVEVLDAVEPGAGPLRVPRTSVEVQEV